VAKQFPLGTRVRTNCPYIPELHNLSGTITQIIRRRGWSYLVRFDTPVPAPWLGADRLLSESEWNHDGLSV
jgi:hypothetical protein